MVVCMPPLPGWTVLEGCRLAIQVSVCHKLTILWTLGSQAMLIMFRVHWRR